MHASLMRPAEVDVLLGDASKARQALGWSAELTLEEMVAEMVEADLARHRGASMAALRRAPAPRRILVTGAAASSAGICSPRLRAAFPRPTLAARRGFDVRDPMPRRGACVRRPARTPASTWRRSPPCRGARAIRTAPGRSTCTAP